MYGSLNLGVEQAFIETFSGELDIVNQELTGSVLSMLTDGALSSLPIAKCFVSLAKTGASLRDYLFAKKALSFLRTSSQVTLKERASFVNKIENDPKYRTRVGETYIYYIEKARDIENTEQIALLSNACVRGLISYDDFLRCVNVITTISSGSLRDFVTLDKNDISESSMDELLSSGLYRIAITPISVRVKDQDEIKAEEDLKKTNPLFSNNYYEALSIFSKVVSDALSFKYPHSSINEEPKGKYRGFVSGGEADFRINTIGLIIKHVLKDYYK